MKTTNNRKYIALLTASVLLGTTVIPLTLPQSAYAATQLAAPISVQINPDGTVMWQAVPNNSGYTIYLYNGKTNAEIATYQAPTNATTYKITTLTINNSYYVKMIARGNGGTYANSSLSAPSNLLATSTHVTLIAPARLNLDAVGLASWDNVQNNGYQLNVYHSPSNTLVTSQTLPKDSNQVSLTGIVPGSASYYYKVIALGDNDQMSNSAESAASPTVALTFSRLPAPSNPALSEERVATWSAVAGNNGYRITVYNADNDQILGFAQSAKDVTTADLKDLINRDGNYYIRVQTLGTGTNSSEDSARSTAQVFYVGNNLYYVRPNKLIVNADTSTTDEPLMLVDVMGDAVVNDLKSKPTSFNLLTVLPAAKGRLLLNLPGPVVTQVLARSKDATLRIQSELANVTLPLSDLQDLAATISKPLNELTLQVELAQTVKKQPAELEMSPMLFEARLLDATAAPVATLTDTVGYIGFSTVFSKTMYNDLHMLSGVRLNPAGGTSTIPATFTPNLDGSLNVTFHYQGTGTFSVARKNLNFPDVPANHYAKISIEALSSKLVINGFEDGTFRPNDTVTRAQFATMLIKTLGLKEKQLTGTTRTFSDVALDAWFTHYVETAYRDNLISGMGDGSFAPEDTISAQDMAVMIARAYKYANPTAPALTDAEREETLSKIMKRIDIAPYATDAVALCAKKGILTGMTFISYTPKVAADRAMAADMLYQLLKALNFSN
jgi:hypothetical protein